MTSSEQINEIAKAMAAAQSKLRPAAKDAVNPAFRSRYADLSAVAEAAKVYAAEGVAIVQDAQSSEAGVSVSTRLLHTSGQWIEVGPLTVPVGKKDAHGIGSATTYAKRYSLGAAGLIVAGDEDDDGNAAVASAPAEPAGYAEWLLDFSATADNGVAALTEAWKSAPEAFRKHLPAATRDRLKAKAQQVAA